MGSLRKKCYWDYTDSSEIIFVNINRGVMSVKHPTDSLELRGIMRDQASLYKTSLQLSQQG